MDIKPIETFYNGYRFRSRLEARWAVFFDAAGIKYEYEPEGFDLGNGIYYLPDFYLPELDVWCEVKGTKISEEDKRKIDLFRGDPEDGSARTLLMLREIPIAEDEWSVVGDTYGDDYGNGDIGWDNYYQFCVCPACGKIGLAFDGRGWRVCGKKHKNKNSITQTYEDYPGDIRIFKYHMDGRTDDKGYTPGVPLLANAYLKARQARFEHGEKPSTDLKALAYRLKNAGKKIGDGG